MELSVAFDTIDHDKLLTYLSYYLGFDDNALKFITYYLSDRTQYVKIKEILSETRKRSSRKCPRTLELCIYMLPIYSIMRSHNMRSHNMRYHIYADSTHLLLLTPQLRLLQYEYHKYSMAPHTIGFK